MKRYILFELMQLIREKPHLKRKLKYFVVFGLAIALVGVVIISAFAIWAGTVLFGYAKEVAVSPQLPAQIEAAKSSLSNLPPIAKVGCWDKTMSMLNVGTWLERPLAGNFESLKQACLGSAQPESSAPAGDWTKAIEQKATEQKGASETF